MVTKNEVSVIRKYNNHILQNNPKHREEEPQNIYSNIYGAQLDHQKNIMREYGQGGVTPTETWATLKRSLCLYTICGIVQLDVKRS